jgi:hypothetical protein
VYGYLLRNKWQDTLEGSRQFSDFENRDLQNDEPQFLAGIDIQTENIRRCDKHRIYDSLALARAETLPFAPNSFDTILCVEVLEHLQKPEALTALRSFEIIATRCIVLTVPRSALDPSTGKDERAFLKLNSQDPEVLEWVEAETHKSCFSIAELRGLGFRIGRPLGTGWRARARMAMNIWECWRSAQILAVKVLGDRAASASYLTPPPPRYTEGYPDYR